MKAEALLLGVVLITGCEGPGPAGPVIPPAPSASEVSVDVVYTKVDLGVFKGCSGSRAFDINSSGRIVGDGSGGPCGLSRALAWTPKRVIVRLPHPAGSTFSSALATNDFAQTVGFSSPGGHQRAVYWPSNTSVQYLPDFGGFASYAADINNNGMIVGWSDLPDGSTQAVSWQGGVIAGLELLAGGSFSMANGVNNQGQIVGLSNDGSGTVYAVMWDINGSLTQVLAPDAQALAINNDPACPTIVGESGSHGFSYDACTRQWTDLLTLGGSTSSAHDVNDRLRVVGWSFLSSGLTRGFDRVLPNRNNLNLGLLAGYTASVAEGVNFCDQIVGYSTKTVAGVATDRATLWNTVCR